MDTNVLLSALFFKSGLSAAVLNYAILGNEPITSEWLLTEFHTKLNSPAFRKKNRNYHFDEETISRITDFTRHAFKLLTPDNPLPTLCRDPDDNNVLQLAEYGQAHYLITGDKDLLILKNFGSCQIVSPRSFAQLVGIIQ
ncbi:putative toxin-antitoxin system toxin component, PIN family [Persicitalea jodogahamensis]|uniref:putative toxin-antitoxin system toxin component, PIN family n=1 Tax=Persicitalea jodogahamensis TaxID=402147 RepID=UPI0016785778